ncbi:hypothetical protein, partial [Actinotignum timonense]
MTQRISRLASTLTVTTLALTMAGTVAAHAQPAAGSPAPGASFTSCTDSPKAKAAADEANAEREALLKKTETAQQELAAAQEAATA